MFRNRSLKFRLAFWSVVCVFLVALGARFLAMYGIYSYFEDEHVENIHSYMHLAAFSLREALESANYLELRECAQFVSQFPGITGVRIADSNGHVLLTKGDFSGTLLREPIGPTTPLGRITVSFSKQPLTDGVKTVTGIEGIVLVLLLLGSYAALWRISHFYLDDLSRLTTFIQEEHIPLGQEYPGAGRGDEIGLLASTMKRRDLVLAEYQHKLERHRQELEVKVAERTRELQQEKVLSETILNSIPDALSLIDVRDYRILDANSAFAQAYGVSREAAHGQTCADIRAAQGLDCYTQGCPIDAYFEDCTPKLFEHVHEEPKGNRRHLEVVAWPVTDELGQVVQMVHVERDVTERKRIEAQRQQVEQIVRHDLKSPLNGIYGMAQVLEMEEGISGEQAEYVQHIKGSVLKILHMIDNSLDMHRMEEGTYELRAEMFDLLEIVLELGREWKHFMDRKALKMTVYLDQQPITDDKVLRVNGERTKLESMFANLVLNALEASPEGGEIRIAVTTGPNRLLIDIHNWGTIPADIQDRFFERYVTAGKERGTGLGTYSARLVARAHGGDITFQSSDEDGTHLYVQLPVMTEGRRQEGESRRETTEAFLRENPKSCPL